MLKRRRHMCSMRLGLVSMGLALYLALLDATLWPFGEVAVQAAEGEPTPPPSIAAADLSAIRKQIVLRTIDGKPVPGITVHLSPAAPALGGPDPEAGQQKSAVQPKSGVTDAQGQVIFTGLGQWVWIVSFGGTFEGKAVQPAQEQGESPYGRTRTGGGFPVMVEAQEEDAPATPVVVNGVQQPDVQASLFVLVSPASPVSASDVWIPALDLALPGETPQPLNLISSQVSTPATPSIAMTPRPGAAQSKEAQAEAPVSDASNVPDATNTLDDLIKWFYLLPMGMALLALYKGWQERKRERQQQVAQPVTRPSVAEGQEGER